MSGEPKTLTLTLEEFLIRDNAAMRRAGCELAEAALNVIREYDGTHRLALAAAAWMQVIADEGGRGEMHGAARTEAEELRAGITAVVKRLEHAGFASRGAPETLLSCVWELRRLAGGENER